MNSETFYEAVKAYNSIGVTTDELVQIFYRLSEEMKAAREEEEKEKKEWIDSLKY